jgi:hypothetical protein
MQKDHTPPQMMHDAVYHITLSNNDELEVIWLRPDCGHI